MATYPYSSGQTAVVQSFAQLRKGFPAKVDAGYLQRFGIAPANESYIISILRFLRLIDDDGNRIEGETGYFFGGDAAFQPGLEATIRAAYPQLFDEMGDGALTAEKAALTNWFRAADKTSDLVGQRQAATFQTLTALAGHGEAPAVRPGNGAKKSAPKAPAAKAAPKQSTRVGTVNTASQDAATSEANRSNHPDVGLTVRIEVNLPPGGDASTYDAIFASIKKHLM